MSKFRKSVATVFAALLLSAALSAPARAVYFEEDPGDSGSISAFFESFWGFVTSVFAANNGAIIP